MLPSDLKSITTDKRCDLGYSNPDQQEFSRELADMKLVFDSLPDDLKNAVIEEYNKNKPVLTEEQIRKNAEETKKLIIQCYAINHGVKLTGAELKWLSEVNKHVAYMYIDNLSFRNKQKNMYYLGNNILFMDNNMW